MLVCFSDCIVIIPSMAAASSPLNKKLWGELTKIKLFDAKNNLKEGKFFYENSSFDHSQDDLPENYAQNVIIGRLWLTSNIYKNHALRIELHLPSGYPMQPPEVIIMTPIYHPNVNEKSE
jgi:ubiquitin-protein ligase